MPGDVDKIEPYMLKFAVLPRGLAVDHVAAFIILVDIIDPQLFGEPQDVLQVGYPAGLIEQFVVLQAGVEKIAAVVIFRQHSRPESLAVFGLGKQGLQAEEAG